MKKLTLVVLIIAILVIFFFPKQSYKQGFDYHLHCRCFGFEEELWENYPCTNGLCPQGMKMTSKRCFGIPFFCKELRYSPGGLYE